MGVALYLRNHYGQVGVGAAAVYTTVYTGVAGQAQKWMTSIFMDHGSRTIDCVMYQDKAFKKLCGSINNQTKDIWDNIHSDTKAVMKSRVSPLEISKDIQQSVTSVSQWVREAASCNQLHYECVKEKKDVTAQLSIAINQIIEAERKVTEAKNEVIKTQAEVNLIQNNVTLAKDETIEAQKNISKTKDEVTKAKDDAKAQIDPCNVRIGECKELENFKLEVDRLKKVEIEYEALKIELKHSKKWAYEKLMGW